MKALLIFLTICSSTFIHTQNLTAQSFKEYTSSFTDIDEFTLMVEAGTLNTTVFRSLELFNQDNTVDRTIGFTSPSKAWIPESGFTAGFKIAKNIEADVYHSKVSLDFITGLVYKESNMNQNDYFDSSQFFPGEISFHAFVDFQMRDIMIRSLEIPMELRSNFRVKNFIFSPIIGFSVDIPLTQTQYHYYPIFENDTFKRGSLYQTEKLESSVKYNFNTISKLEVAYQLTNMHKLKVAGFYNIYIRHQIDKQIKSEEGISTKGIQFSYEIPLSTFIK